MPRTRVQFRPCDEADVAALWPSGLQIAPMPVPVPDRGRDDVADDDDG